MKRPHTANINKQAGAAALVDLYPKKTICTGKAMPVVVLVSVEEENIRKGKANSITPIPHPQENRL
jgi:hypothetical protein